MKLLQEYRGEAIQEWMGLHKLSDYTDTQGYTSNIEYLVGLTIWPMVFRNQMLAANFVLSGATRDDDVWRCIWLDDSLEE